jgi:hypothetical protein
MASGPTRSLEICLRCLLVMLRRQVPRLESRRQVPRLQLPLASRRQVPRLQLQRVALLASHAINQDIAALVRCIFHNDIGMCVTKCCL